MKAILWTHYKAKDGLFPVRIRHTETTNGKTKVTYKDTGVRVLKKQFEGGLVVKHLQAVEFNRTIRGMLKQTSGKRFLDYFADFMAMPHGYYHKRKLTSIYNKIKDRGNNLNLDYIYSLERDLQGKHPNYIADILKNIRTVANLMVKSGDLEFHKNPFVHYKLKKVKTVRGRLTYEQLQALEVVKLDRLRGLARDMYIVAFYQGGIRFGDLCRLNADNVKDGRLCYLMHKTSRERNLPMHPKTAKILKRYRYQFPLDINWEQEDKSINAKNTLMNKYLKAACRIAEIPEVSFHTARHSITDLMVRKGKNPHQIKGVLGHGKLTTTEAYLKGFYVEETDSGLEQLFS